MEADSTVNPGGDAGAESGAGEPTFALPPAFDLETAKQAAYDAVMAQADEPTEDGGLDEGAAADARAQYRESEASDPKPAAKAEAPDAAPDPLAKLSPEDRQAVEDHILSKFQAEQATLKDLQDKANAAEQAATTLRDKFSQWLAPDPKVQAEHDDLKALIYSDDPEKFVRLNQKGHDLETAIARVAALEGQLGERAERSAMSQAISEQERLGAWTAVDQAARSLTDLDGVTQGVLEAGGDLQDMLRRAVVAHGDARAKAVEAEWKGKISEQKAMYERRLTRAGGADSQVVESGGRAGNPGGNFIASVSKNGRLLPGVIERAMNGEFSNMPLGG